MEVKRWLYYFLEILQWSALIGLSIGLAFFVKDIWNDFQSGKTNDRIYTKKVNNYNHPTITICFEPQFNDTALLKYNKTVYDVRGELNMNDIETSVETTLSDITYKAGRDYSLTLMMPNAESKKFLIGNVDDANKSMIPGILEVEELPTAHYGTCTVVKVSPTIKASIQMFSALHLEFNTENVTQPLPLVKVFFTSEKNYYGAIWNQWMEGEVFGLEIDAKVNQVYTVNLKQQTRKQLPYASQCTLTSSYYECMIKG